MVKRPLSLLMTVASAALLTGCLSETVRTQVCFTASAVSAATVKGGEEDPVQSLELLVFRSGDGTLDARASASGNVPLSVDVTRGQKLRWYILANVPEIGNVSESEFLSGRVMIEDGVQQMVTSGQAQFGSNPSPVHAMLNRHACKISVGSVSVPWLSSLDSPECTLSTIALMSAKADSPVSGMPSADGTFLNRASLDDGMMTLHPEIRIANCNPVTVNTILYAMPNPVMDGGYGLPWTPRRTRLAVELLVNGQSNWYPADLPAMEGNRHYHFGEISILGPGADNPDGMILRSNSSFSFDILGWEESMSEVCFDN